MNLQLSQAGGSRYGFGLINQHYGNIIPDFIQQFARIADQTIPGVIEMDIAFAFRASQYIKQFLADSHCRSSHSLSYERRGRSLPLTYSASAGSRLNPAAINRWAYNNHDASIPSRHTRKLITD